MPRGGSTLLTHPPTPLLPPENTIKKRCVVYKVSCGDSPATNVGQTGRTLMHCHKEHRQALTTVNSMMSALAEYAMNISHDFDWSDDQVIDASPLLQQQCTL